MSAVATREQAPAQKKWMVWTGRVLGILPALGLVVSASMKLSHAPAIVSMLSGHLGYPESTITGIGLLELACAALYLIPQTTFLGALLITGYLGGAVASHVRLGEPFGTPLILGVLVWVGLYLRESRLRSLAPLRSPLGSPLGSPRD